MRGRPGLLLVLVSAGVLPACESTVDLGRRALMPDPRGDGGTTNLDVAPPPPDAPDDVPVAPVDTGVDVVDVVMDLDPMETQPSDATAPNILWSGSAEPGDFSEWQQGGSAVGGTYQQMTTVAVSDQQAHSGTRAFRISFDSDNGSDHMAEFYRRVEPTPAYYSAWFYINEAHVPATYWTVFYFFYQLQPGTPSSRRGLWDINLNRQSLYFYDEVGRRQVDALPRKAYPIGQWFHIEVHFSYEGRNGHVQVWMDGDQVMDVANLGAAPSDDLYWGVGSDTDELAPTAATIYIDDAAVSTARIGP